MPIATAGQAYGTSPRASRATYRPRPVECSAACTADTERASTGVRAPRPVLVRTRLCHHRSHPSTPAGSQPSALRLSAPGKPPGRRWVPSLGISARPGHTRRYVPGMRDARVPPRAPAQHRGNEHLRCLLEGPAGGRSRRGNWRSRNVSSRVVPTIGTPTTLPSHHSPPRVCVTRTQGPSQACPRASPTSGPKFHESTRNTTRRSAWTYRRREAQSASVNVKLRRPH